MCFDKLHRSETILSIYKIATIPKVFSKTFLALENFKLDIINAIFSDYKYKKDF